MRQRWLPVVCALVVASGLLLTACSKEKDSDNEGGSSLITAPSSTTTSTSTGTSTASAGSGTSSGSSASATAVAYTQDIQPIMTSSCTRCHGNFGTYSGIMSVVTAGSASSKLVTKTASNGSMYTYLPADRATNSALIKTWVLNGAPQSR
jgi:hypothetical protein